MPNWVNNKMMIVGKREDILKMFAKAEPMMFDGHLCYTLHSFIPMPQTYKDVDTTNSLNCFLYKKEEELRAEHHELPACELKKLFEDNKQKYIDLYENAKKYQKETYGVIGWYDWNCLNIGTKWNAEVISVEEFDRLIKNSGGCDELDIHCYIETAWTPPTPFFEKIIKENPKLYFDIWCDEESGYKFGYEGVNGEFFYGIEADVIEEVKTEIGNIIPERFVEEYNIDEDKRELFVKEFSEISNRFVNSSFWTKGDDYSECLVDYFNNWY